MEMNDKVKETIKDVFLAGDEDDAKRAFEFVAKVCDLAADRLDELEPYATVSIKKLREMERELNDFAYFHEQYFGEEE